MGLLDDFSTLSDSAKQYALDKLAQFGNGVGNTVQAIPANANRLAQGLLNLPQQASNEVGQLFSPQTNNKLAGLLSQPQQANPGQWMDQGMALAGMAPVGGLIGMTKGADGLLGMADNVAMKPLTEKQFYNQYAQHIDIRGRDGSAADNMKSIVENGFGKSSNVNAMPASRGGPPLNVIDKKYSPQSGDTLYLVPKSAYVEGPNGLKVKEGWTPQPHEVINITDPEKPMYQYYMEAISRNK